MAESKLRRLMDMARLLRFGAGNSRQPWTDIARMLEPPPGRETLLAGRFPAAPRRTLRVVGSVLANRRRPLATLLPRQERPQRNARKFPRKCC